MRTLFLEPFSGLAGDMLLAALLDLEDPRFTLDDLRSLSEMLVPGESRITVETAWRQNLSGKLLTLTTPESERAPHRGLKEIAALIEKAPLSHAVKARALAVFRRIAVAEGKVHGCSPDEIHFHEVGAVDTIVDVCGACFALERLEVERVVSIAPVTGTGTVRCAHGLMPVPAPAVAELLRGRECRIEGGGGERLTPTGAALLVEFCDHFAAPGAFTAERVGYGAGHRDPKEGPPNIVRIQLGTSARDTRATSPLSAPATHVLQIEVNLDDMTGEELAFVADRLRKAGALDVWTQAVTMKKGRPGVVVFALARPEMRAELESVIFDTTTTFGVRWTHYERTEAAREAIEVDVLGAQIRVKVRRLAGRMRVEHADVSPEHDDVAALATQLSRSTREIEALAIQAALARFR
ncbi:MAG: nickel pincer cofactor biosynthesis protein LarC [Planctomycetota bacterium]|nr:nickel pincer cofactor biosynthesis protein LarC [Planctomycetota bacterium]